MAEAISWTPEQLSAIETHGTNILVAAAAGSGKTAVLVERVIRMICNNENPVSVDRLLILTFTTAAADEMKRKIATAINKKLAENPGDSWLKEQSIKVNSAAISTIHAFCSRIISNNAHLTNLPSNYTLISDSAENDILINRALDEVLEAYYSRIDKREDFKHLVLSSGTKDDKELRELIIKLYKFSQSLPNPSKWLGNIRSNLYAKVDTLEDFCNSLWYKPIKDKICAYAEIFHNTLLKLTEILSSAEVPSDSPHYKYYFGLLYEYAPLYESLDTDKPEDFKRLCDYLAVFKFPRVSTSQKFIGDIKPMLNFYRKEVAGTALEKAKELIKAFRPDYIQKFSKFAPSIRVLCNIVRLLERTHLKYKRERSAIDFSDLEHQLLKLIRTNDGKETNLCKQLREHYDEIMLDEFQDTNSLQFEIFSLLSQKQGNLFMVGDVKQSIYKFRNADPSIFLKLYNDYGKEKGGKLIRLFKNFRSRSEVVESVNHIFNTVMTPETGGIDYTEEEFLIRGANYPQRDEGVYTDFKTEIMITHIPETATDPVTGQKIEASAIEAENAAKRIVSLIKDENFYVTDKESGKLRPARFGDVAVLAPGWSGCICMEEALNNLGVSCFCEKSSHYLDSVEVSTVLAFLQIIDNPLQDIPLIAVLKSPIFGFTANELAVIRSLKKGRFYTAIKAGAKKYEAVFKNSDSKPNINTEGATPEDYKNLAEEICTCQKAYNFLNVLLNLREDSKHLGVDRLVHKICYDLDYISMVSVMKDGELKKANLKLLMKRCGEFEQGVLSGLFNFIQYIEKLRANDEDLRPADGLSDFDNTVTIMTIHKSKGLEFPVVLLFGTDKRINTTDASKRFVWDTDLGLASDYVDTDLRVCYDMPQKALISTEIKKELYAERLRLLYVAMTRAKEKLIISATQQKISSSWKNAVFTEDGRMHPSAVLAMPSMRDWIWGSLLTAPDGKILREFGDRIDIIPNCHTEAEYTVYMTDKDFNIQITNADKENFLLIKDNVSESSTEDTVSNKSSDNLSDDLINTSASTLKDISTDLENRINYKYPHTALTTLPIKLSVSELKRRRMPDEEHSVKLINPDSGLIHGTEDISAAEKGTITHFVIQHIDIQDTDSKESIELQIKKMTEDNIINQKQYDAVNIDSIAEFFDSPLGKRLKNAERYEREYDFYMVVPASEAYPDVDSDAEIMVQGIADCFFFDKETGEIVLIDYKTDRVSAAAAHERSKMYEIQTEYYAKGIESIFNVPVTEKYLYFLNCAVDVKMP